MESMIDKALELAVNAHAGQVDKAGRPYILHCLRVAAKFAGDDTLYCIAILHDVVEDTLGKPNQISVSDLRAWFGAEISDAVEALSRRPGEDYLTSFIPRCKANLWAKLVKIADLTDNLNPDRVPACGFDHGEMGRVRRYYKALQILEG